MSRSVTFQRFLCMAIAALIIPQYEIAHSLALDKSASRNPIQDELTFEQAVKSAKDFLAAAKDQETDFTEQLARYSGAKGIIYTLDLVDCHKTQTALIAVCLFTPNSAYKDFEFYKLYYLSRNRFCLKKL